MARAYQVALLPAQLGRLAELFPSGGAVGISQNGSTITAYNGSETHTLNAKGEPIEKPKEEPSC